MIDQLTIDRILDVANIVDIVSEFVTLRRRGVNYVGLCPFHTDKTPSFYVSPAKNICKCFACGEGGTAVHFIMKHEQLNYFDALRFLAKKYNIEIQERELSDREKQVQGDRESMFIVNGWAQKYFSTQLYEHVEGKSIGLRYFVERGFRDDIIKKFQLGYSLDQRDALFQASIQGGYKKEYVEKTGLIISYDNGGVNDRFRGRVLFPVHSLSGKVVAFGGRTLKKDDKTAKYVNSPESEIYHKSNELYGIYFAKQAIVKADQCFLVEGYTDVISMHQAGIENVVASSGTALTQPQIRLIHRFTNNITVLYDGDAAGIKAALRGIDLLLEEGLNVKVVLLPNGEDPDSFARKHNATQLTAYIKESETDFIRFKTKLLLDDAADDPMKRSSLISDIIRSIAIIPDTIIRSIYIRESSAMLEIDERIVLNEVNKIRQSNEEKRPLPAATKQTQSEFGDASFYQASTTPDLPADYPFPPPNQGFDESEGVPQQQTPAMPADHTAGVRSPFELYELALLRYVIRYGERILYDYTEEKTNEHIRMKVAAYIQYDLTHDDLSFQTPLFKTILEEAAERSADEAFVAQRYFLAHPNAAVSRLAANVIGEKYHLSKIHTKYREIENEEDKLPALVVRELYAFKDAYIHAQIKEIQNAMKESQRKGEMDDVMEQMTRLSRLNEIKSVLSKELGERIILKM